MSKKTILLLGASGMVGKDLISFFMENYNVVALFRNKTSFTKTKMRKVQYIKHDMIKNLNTKYKIDYIINCIVTHPYSKKNKLQDYIDSNIITSKNIISLAKKQNIKLLINLSSVVVYGRPNQKNITENTPIQNLDFLGTTKLFFEKALEFENINYVNLRLPGVLCKTFDNKRPWLNTLISQIKNNKNVKIYNGNSNFNNLITTYEIYKLILLLLSKKVKIKDNYNFACSRSLKLIKIANIIKLKFNSKSKITNQEIKKKSPLISSSKLLKDFNYKTDPIEKVLNDYLEMIK